MRPIIYHVAITQDGFIADENGQIDFFDRSGPQIEDYIRALTAYDTFLMGKSLYQFSFQYGLTPGESPYPHMNGYIYSRELDLTPIDPKLSFEKDYSKQVEQIKALKEIAGRPIFLAGGVQFAKSLIRKGLVDEVHERLHPIQLGNGLSGVQKAILLEYFIPLSRKTYTNGVVLTRYNKK